MYCNLSINIKYYHIWNKVPKKGLALIMKEKQYRIIITTVIFHVNALFMNSYWTLSTKIIFMNPEIHELWHLCLCTIHEQFIIISMEIQGRKSPIILLSWKSKDVLHESEQIQLTTFVILINTLLKKSRKYFKYCCFREAFVYLIHWMISGDNKV